MCSMLVTIVHIGHCAIFSNSIKMAAHRERIELHYVSLGRRISIWTEKGFFYHLKGFSL